MNVCGAVLVDLRAVRPAHGAGGTAVRRVLWNALCHTRPINVRLILSSDTWVNALAASFLAEHDDQVNNLVVESTDARAVEDFIHRLNGRVDVLDPAA